MKKVFIDEYLSVELRQRIDKLVELNLDLESILSLLSNDLYDYADYMLDEVKRYLKYLLWLRDHHKDRTLAFEKYKAQTKQNQKNAEILPSKSPKIDAENNLKNELFLVQLQKERQRIDEISSLHYQKNAAPNEEKVDEEETLKLATDPVDEILESLSDEEIQAALSEMLTTEFDPTSLDIKDLTLKDAENEEEDPDPQEKKQSENEESILDEPNQDQELKTLDSPTNQIEDLTLDDIINDSITSPLTNGTQNLFEVDDDLDNGTETLDDSSLLVNGDEDLAPEYQEINLELNEEISADKSNDEELISEEEEEEEEEELGLDETEEIIEETDELVATDDALNFLEELEAKYGDETLVSLDEEKDDLSTNNFSLAEPTLPLKIGAHVHYQNQDYVVENIEIELDFFHHQQTIVTLIDVENQEKIQINAKKIK